MPEDVPENCEVCGDSMDANHNANCALCGRIFHLTWDTRLPIRDCGRFDIDEESLALYFTCNDCVAKQPQAAPGPA